MLQPPSSCPGPRLLWASQHGNVNVVKEILAEDAKMAQYRDEDGYTPLHRAAYSNHAHVAKLLLEAGNDVLGADLAAALTEDGWTPLHSAARWNAVDAMEVLLGAEGGADINAVTTGGQTVLHLAAFVSKREGLQLRLMEPRLSAETLTAKNCQGDTALDIARRNGKCAGLLEALQDAAVKEVVPK